MRISAIDAYSTYLFHQGTNYSSYRLFGAHLTSWKQKSSVRFCRPTNMRLKPHQERLF